MPLPRLFASTLLMTFVAAGAAFAADLKVGDPAPALELGTFVKGDPVGSIENDKTYVLECWATWCGPCVAAIPHVTELQAKHKDVVFIGVNVWEQDESKVEPFVAKMGDKMDYRVVMDDKSKHAEGAVATNWLKAAGRNGIPCSFIVHDGKIAWIGHPMAMEDVLDQVVSGKFDPAEAQQKEARQQRLEEAFTARIPPFLQNGDFAGAAKAVDELIVEFPAAAKELHGFKFGMLLQAKLYDEAYLTADKFAELVNDDANGLNAIAWTIVDAEGIERRDLDRAEKYITRAVELQPDNAEILDTLARVHAEKGDLAKAIQIQEKAIANAEGDMKNDLQKTLDGYKAKNK